MQGSGFRVQGAECRVQGAGCRVQGAGCKVQGSGCRDANAPTDDGDEECRVVADALPAAVWRASRYRV